MPRLWGPPDVTLLEDVHLYHYAHFYKNAWDQDYLTDVDDVTYNLTFEGYVKVEYAWVELADDPFVMLGEDPMILEVGDTFDDPNVNVVDERGDRVAVLNGDVSGLDMSSTGVYWVRYYSKNDAGEDYVVETRTVFVGNPCGSSGGLPELADRAFDPCI